MFGTFFRLSRKIGRRWSALSTIIPLTTSFCQSNVDRPLGLPAPNANTISNGLFPVKRMVGR